MNDNIKEEKPNSVSWIVYEGTVSRYELRVNKLTEQYEKRIDGLLKLIKIIVITSIIGIAGVNLAWLAYESLYDTISYSQDGNGVNNINTHTQGDIVNGTTSENKAAEGRQSKGD